MTKSLVYSSPRSGIAFGPPLILPIGPAASFHEVLGDTFGSSGSTYFFPEQASYEGMFDGGPGVRMIGWSLGSGGAGYECNVDESESSAEEAEVN